MLEAIKLFAISRQDWNTDPRKAIRETQAECRRYALILTRRHGVGLLADHLPPVDLAEEVNRQIGERESKGQEIHAECRKGQQLLHTLAKLDIELSIFEQSPADQIADVTARIALIAIDLGEKLGQALTLYSFLKSGIVEMADKGEAATQGRSRGAGGTNARRSSWYEPTKAEWFRLVRDEGMRLESKIDEKAHEYLQAMGDRVYQVDLDTIRRRRAKEKWMTQAQSG